MTIRLLCDRDGLPANSIVRLDTGTENGLVSAKLASFDLTGGVAPNFSSDQTKPGLASINAEQAGTLVAGQLVQAGLPILCLGGDHPYSQWTAGMAAMYLDAGVKPYIAINTATEAEQIASGISLEPVGSPRRMSYSELRALQAKGVEIVGHGHRHPTSWQQINTGIRIRYLGANGTATVNIDNANLTLTAAAGAETAALAFATYTTLAALVAAINATTNWSAVLAPELLGTEPSKSLLRLNAARSVKSTTASQYFAAGGGLWFDWQPGSGDNYAGARAFAVRTTSSSFLKIVIGGVIRANIDLASVTTLSGVVSAINALSISGLRVQLTDNRVTEVARENYLQGDETPLSALPSGGSAYVVEIGHRPAVMASGLGQMYCVHRQYRRCKEVLAAEGLAVTQFAQSGAYMLPTDTGAGSDYRGFRVDPSAVLSIFPFAMPMATLANSNWYPHVGVTYAAYPSAESLKAITRALVDSGPWYVNLLCHALLVDGSSGYPIANTDPTPQYDQTESNMVAFLADLRQRIAAGAIQCPTTGDAQAVFKEARAPGNLLFNPRFQNSGASMSGKWNAGTGTGNMGSIVPGWHIASDSSVFSALVPVDDGLGDGTGKLRWTGIGGEGLMLSAETLSVPGVYEFGAICEMDAAAASGGYIYASARLSWGGYDKTRSNDLGNTSPKITVAGASNLALRFIVEPATRELPAVYGLSGTYNLSVNNQITLSFGGKATVGPINVAGATPGATTAGEVAAAINAALLASTTYGYEYRNCASVEQGRIVLRDVEFYDPTTGTLGLTVTGNAATAVFGGDGWGLPGTNANASEITPVQIRILGGFTGNVTLSQPYLKRVSSL